MRYGQAALFVIGLTASYAAISLFFISPAEQVMMAEYMSETWNESELPDYRQFHHEEVKVHPPGEIYELHRPNTTVRTDDWYRMRVKKINSKGLREEPFSTVPEENVTRILFLGDSFTFGSGVNASDRYTDIVERWLNRDNDERYQAINAGIGGAGILDFYRYLEVRGVDYRPDVVVVSVSYNDIWDRRSLDIKRQEFLEKENITRPLNKTEQQRINSFMREYKRDSLEEEDSTALIPVLDLIRNTTRDAGAELVVHGYLLRNETPVRNWAEDSGVKYVGRNPKFRWFPEDAYLIPWDNHYNRLGHYWMAEQLTPPITDIVREDKGRTILKSR